MFLLALNFRFDPSTSLTPLVHQLPAFLLSSLLLQFAVLLLPPDRLQLLLEQLICRVVVEVAGATLKPVLILEFDSLRCLSGLVNSPEGVVRQSFHSFLSLSESRLLSHREMRVRSSLTTSGTCISADFELRAEVSVQKTILVVLVLF